MTIDEAEMELVQFLEEMIKSGTLGKLYWDELNLTEFGMLKSSEDIQEQVRDSGYLDTEFMYYHEAMEYLSEEDSSLEESMEIAYEYGSSIKDLNSTYLAAILASRRNEEKFGEEYDSDAVQEKIDELNAQIEREEEE